jgi:hypothetical protein
MDVRSRPPTLAAGASSLETLSPELLENILLKVVGDMPPIVTYDDHCGSVLQRCDEGPSYGTSLVGPLLAHRLVSRTIRDSSWRSLAKVIGETIFDLRSQNSIENLIGLTRCTELVPWVHKLTISCFVVRNGYPYFTGYVPYQEDIRDELLEVSCTEKQWYPSAWKWAIEVAEHADSGSDYAYSPTDETWALVELLGVCFRSLNQLNAIHYHYDGEWIPGRFEQIVANHTGSVADWDFSVGMEGAGAHGAYLGQFVLVEALAVADTKVKTLELAVSMGGPHSFEIFSPSATIKRVLQSVETLTLRDELIALDPKSPMPPSVSTVTITKANFPNLRSLTLQAWYGWFFRSRWKHMAPLPKPADVTRLTNITIACAQQSDPQILEFLQLFKDTVRSVTLRRMETSYEPILMSWGNSN